MSLRTELIIGYFAVGGLYIFARLGVEGLTIPKGERAFSITFLLVMWLLWPVLAHLELLTL